MNEKRMTIEEFRAAVLREILAALDELNAKGIKCGPVKNLEVEWTSGDTWAQVDPRRKI